MTVFNCKTQYTYHKMDTFLYLNKAGGSFVVLNKMPRQEIRHYQHKVQLLSNISIDHQQKDFQRKFPRAHNQGRKDCIFLPGAGVRRAATGAVPRDLGALKRQHLPGQPGPRCRVSSDWFISGAYHLLKTPNILFCCETSCGSLFLTENHLLLHGGCFLHEMQSTIGKW